MANDERTNVLRTRRLAKLVVDINTAQINLSTTFDSSQNTLDFMDEHVEKFMQDRSLTTRDDLREWVRGSLNDQQRQTYDAIVEFNQKFGEVGNINDTIMITVCILAGHLIGSSEDKDISLTNFTHVIAMLRITQVYVKGFKLLSTSSFKQANDYLQKARAVFRQAFADDFDASTRFGKLVGTIAQFVQFSGDIGMTVTKYKNQIAKITDPAEKSQALITAIHQTQVSRLSLGYFNVESTTLFGIIAGLSTWLLERAYEMPGWEEEAVSQAKSIAEVHDTPTTTLPTLQTALRKGDGKNYYKDDDLSDKDVIAAAVIDVKGAA